MAAVLKSGSLRSEAWLMFVRRQPCSFCHRQAPSDPHHFPTRGASGVTRDDLTCPACRGCHDACDGNTVVDIRGEKTEPIESQRQYMAVLATRSRFLEQATELELMQFIQDRRLWQESRGVAF